MFRPNSMRAFPAWVLGLLLVGLSGINPARSADLVGARIQSVEGRVQISRAGATAWDPVHTNAVLEVGDRLRTGQLSRATLLLRDSTVCPVDELSELRVVASSDRTVIELIRGVMSFFHRDRPGDLEVRGAGTSAIVRGTEFAASVGDDGLLSLTLFDGRVEVTNSLGAIVAQGGDLIQAGAGEAPRRSPGFASTNRSAIQWSLYYPAVLDPDDLILSPASAERWGPILGLYRSGALWEAADRALVLGEPVDDAERLLQAALRLSVGDVRGFEQVSASIRPDSQQARIREALGRLVHAVQFLPVQGTTGRRTGEHSSTTEWMVDSYCLQSEGRLRDALEAAQGAVRRSPRLGFAHVRVAELQFGFGRVGAARSALRAGLTLGPRNAAALALDGFLMAAAGRIQAARARFDEALREDPSLGNAWLGRGLVRIRTGDRDGGRLDIETAAALEPMRSSLRSYLGKAFAEEGEDRRAFEELARAIQLDPNDPTPWLYRSLVEYREYRLSDAIEDLERSSELNGNRAVYRSRLLLDQDAAVRSDNLANIYALADMADVSRREAARAVMFDYANYSAHLNLSGSYNALRDPTRYNLRNEAVWSSEHLLACLLAPTESVPLSQNLSQNEYSGLFAKDRVGFSTTTEYFGSGQFREAASQYGNFDRFSYALDLDSMWGKGLWPRQELTRIEWFSRMKFELAPTDSVMLMTKYEDYESNDNFQHLDPREFRPDFRFSEQQQPIILGGYHHEWSPGSHTLMLGGRLVNQQQLSDKAAPWIVGFQNPASLSPADALMDLQYWNSFEGYTAEVNQIFQGDRYTTILGGRFQTGQFDALADFNTAPSRSATAFAPQILTQGNGNLERRSLYIYPTCEVLPDLRLTAGVSYDDITSPVNFRRPPLQSGDTVTVQWSPKVAVVYAPTEVVTVRGIYAQSLGGVTYDESLRLEPTQLAGFPQTFRTIISESLVGSVETPLHTVGGMAVDLTLPTRTWLSLEGKYQGSQVDQQSGYFNYDSRRRPAPYALPASMAQSLSLGESTGVLTANQTLARDWFLMGAYQFTRADLESTLLTIPAPLTFSRNQSFDSNLQRITASVLYQRPDGWFGRVLLNWYDQENSPNVQVRRESFPQLDLFAGYRFPKLHGDVTVGVLNVTDQAYGLYPLTIYQQLPYARMLYVRLRINL
jgi:tetratricopeptide (TPR) repeat protein